MSQNQKQKVLNYMKDNGSITCADAVYYLGIMRLPARIADLKEEGHLITSRMELGTNRFGDPVRYARYSLVKPNAVQKGE